MSRVVHHEIEHELGQGTDRRVARIHVLDAGPLDAPVVVLLHGLASDGDTWRPLVESGVRRGLRTVVPDLLGHGASDKPRTGYTLDGFAAQLVDVLRQLEIDSATFVGHSFGGAVAMHFAYRHPEQTDGLVLIAAGGLGRGVHPILRAAAVPGSERVIAVLLNSRTRRLWAHPRLRRTLRLRPEAVENLARIGRNITAPASRAAFFATLRHVIAPGGQRGSMIEMRYFEHALPVLIVWAENDPVIPVSHAHELHAHLPHSRLEVFPGATHEPHRREHERLAGLLAEFCREPDRTAAGEPDAAARPS